ncbi:hypothetical protein L6452_30878 [Arctium lappa]|uniref:Uncharacterized protein n=1 Tax=Arctium lappa TaxID=4217 RepID=A0ACB8ZKB1_ARCLA|nr:hypothetical protein L6452_30878 [Arctium lappa]
MIHLRQQKLIKNKNMLLKYNWKVEAMQEELLQFKRNEVWTLVPLPKCKIAIGTKWVFRNKKDEDGVVIRNKARLVAKGYYLEGKSVEFKLYRDSDYGGCKLDRNSTSESCQFLGVMWKRTQLKDYGFDIDKIPILCASKSVIAISANPVQHYKTKHIDIRYHFLKHHVEHGTIEMYFVSTDYQLADLFIKALDEKRLTLLLAC